MDVNEFRTWFSQHVTAFPQVAAWANVLPDKIGTMGFWQRPLDDVLLVDATDATARLLRGDEDPIQFPSDTPARIRRIARECRQRRSREQPAEYQIADDGKRAFPVSGIYEALREARASGKSDQECTALLESLLPTCDPQSEPRYKCTTCQDAGTLSVWSEVSMKAMAQGRFGAFGTFGTFGISSVACRCQTGRNRYPSWTVYDPAQWCLIRSLHSQESIEQLREFMASFESRASRPYDEFESMAVSGA